MGGGYKLCNVAHRLSIAFPLGGRKRGDFFKSFLKDFRALGRIQQIEAVQQDDSVARIRGGVGCPASR